MRNWYVIYSKPRQESEAEAQLQRQGYEVWLPRLERSRRHQGRWRDVVEPLFPRYLFAHLDLDNENVAPIRSTRGVTGFVRFGGYPVTVPDSVIEALRGCADPDSGLHRLVSQKLERGEPISVIEGPFEGLQGVFQMEKGADRAVVLLEILGRVSAVTLAKSSLSRPA